MLRNAVGGGVSFPRKTCYEGARFNVISITRGWVGVNFPGKKHYVTLEWPLIANVYVCKLTLGKVSCILYQL